MENTPKSFEFSYPVKALAAVAIFASIVILSCTRSTTAPPITEVPPGSTGQDIAELQNQANTNLKSDRDTDSMQWAARVEENMLRGEGVNVISSLDVHLDDRGRIIAKDTRTEAAVLPSDVGRARLSRTDFVRDPRIRRTRKIDVRSFGGDVWIDDRGYTNHL